MKDHKNLTAARVNADMCFVSLVYVCMYIEVNSMCFSSLTHDIVSETVSH